VGEERNKKIYYENILEMNRRLRCRHTNIVNGSGTD
jgi:hypothetical protein